MSKIYHRNCKWCGDPFDTEQRGKVLCPVCTIAKKKKDEQRKKSPKEDKLGDMLHEIDDYNRKHGTALSYGQYVSKFGK